MRFSRFLTRRRCLIFGTALSVAGIIGAHRDAPAHAEEGVVYVYFPSMCAAPGDGSDCHEMPQENRPGFASMQDCFAFAYQDLARFQDPKVMASCMRVKEL